MVRRKVLLDVEGFDETLKTGLEDWDFWLRCADQGYWGYTIPECFDWFRRRQDHGERWAAWTPKGEREVRRKLRQRYPKLFAQGLPLITPRSLQPYGSIPQHIPFENPLTKNKKRILFIIPWMAMGGADRFNLDAVSLLAERGYEISIATTLPHNYVWFSQFARITPDIFILPHFLRLNDYPRFLDYLIQSRRADLVFLSNSELGYKLLPYLRFRHPEVTFVDYCHMEEEYWRNGGHPRSAVAYQELVELNLVASEHLKNWMTERGADPIRIETCYINVDVDRFAPDPQLRSKVRAELKIPSQTPVLVYAGRLCEQKQPKVFAPVMRELKARGLDFVCLVAGDGEDRKWLRHYLRRHHLSKNVWMLGAVSHERMRDLLAASDIFFLPSKMEGISLAIYEAMAMGLVPVGADVGGQRELVTPDCGVLVQRGSPEEEVAAYAEVLQTLIKSPERRNALGQASRDRVCTHFRLEQMGERMEKLLDQAGQLHRSRPTSEISMGLAVEHAVQAVEAERIAQAAGPLWKYQVIESTRGKLTHWLAPRIWFLNRATFHLYRPVRKAKDWIWIVGHRLKMHLLGVKEPD
jgi:glycosyltransferase involved in cell wall biosynthesis